MRVSDITYRLQPRQGGGGRLVYLLLELFGELLTMFIGVLVVYFLEQADRSVGQKLASHLNMRPSI